MQLANIFGFPIAQVNALSLQDLCRYKIRSLLRKAISVEHPDYYDCLKPTRINENKRKRPSSANETPWEMSDEHDAIRNARLTETQFRLLIRGKSRVAFI
jgi:hypothetical protein